MRTNRPARKAPRRQPRRRRFIRRNANQCEHYVVGDVVLVARDGAIVTVLPKGWLA